VRKQVDITLNGSKFILLKNGVDLTPEEQNKLAVILSQSRRLKLAYELRGCLKSQLVGKKALSV
jgi:hypothetical protein